MTKDAISPFINAFQDSAMQANFARLVLSDYRGSEPDLKKITIRRVIIKREDRFSFVYTYKTRDITKNHSLDDAGTLIADYLASGFRAALLQTTAFDLSYPSLKQSKATMAQTPPPSHDIAKNRHIKTEGKAYLHALGITDKGGNVIKSAQDKYRQIDKYIEILGGLVKSLPPNSIKKIADMGAGKGYLTFALHDYLREQNIPVKTVGIEYRKDLVDLCNKIAVQSTLDGLSFKQGSIENFDAKGTDLLIALHACDTATDDAIAAGIKAGASLIVVAPCCHKQIRREIEKGKKKNDLAFLTKYGTLLERQAEMATDAMRALLLEHAGYSVNLFEFISDSHTPKNVMITARKTGKSRIGALEDFHAAKAYFGIDRHHLEDALDL